MIRGTRSQSSQDNAQTPSASNECGTEAPRFVSPIGQTLSAAPMPPRRWPSFIVLIDPPLHHARSLHCRHGRSPRSEEHTSELQSLMRISYAVFCLKKKNK